MSSLQPTTPPALDRLVRTCLAKDPDAALADRPRRRASARGDRRGRIARAGGRWPRVLPPGWRTARPLGPGRARRGRRARSPPAPTVFPACPAPDGPVLGAPAPGPHLPGHGRDGAPGPFAGRLAARVRRARPDGRHPAVASAALRHGGPASRGDRRRPVLLVVARRSVSRLLRGRQAEAPRPSGRPGPSLVRRAPGRRVPRDVGARRPDPLRLGGGRSDLPRVDRGRGAGGGGQGGSVAGRRSDQLAHVPARRAAVPLSRAASRRKRPAHAGADRAAAPRRSCRSSRACSTSIPATSSSPGREPCSASDSTSRAAAWWASRSRSPIRCGTSSLRGGRRSRLRRTVSSPTSPADDRSRLAWIDRSGRELGSVGVPADNNRVRISPDGRRVLFDRRQPGLGSLDLWTADLGRGTETRLTSDPQTDVAGAWAPDGSAVVFSAARGGPPHLFRKDLATGVEEELLPAGPLQFVQDVSPDGRPWCTSSEPSAATSTSSPCRCRASARPRRSSSRRSTNGTRPCRPMAASWPSCPTSRAVPSCT